MIQRRVVVQLRSSLRCCYATSSFAASKVVNSAMEAVKEIPDKSILSVGGFGVCGKYGYQSV